MCCEEKGKFRVDEKKNIKRGIDKDKKKDLLGLFVGGVSSGGTLNTPWLILSEKWWSNRDSNPGPLPCKGSALIS